MGGFGGGGRASKKNDNAKKPIDKRDVSCKKTTGSRQKRDAKIPMRQKTWHAKALFDSTKWSWKEKTENANATTRGRLSALER